MILSGFMKTNRKKQTIPNKLMTVKRKKTRKQTLEKSARYPGCFVECHQLHSLVKSPS